ncbi:hypothetical protein HF086_016840 [Spodoptera exigua]|uniref:Major facilitator superfamily (MFS) profile domain-containing protein n=1 Tax=Spodoptera exigua TaxID=7107 RepID=A0A922LZZ9_SPOEX|nr:hypothetical protein HF086_016840 [Spodoptera exigua]
MAIIFLTAPVQHYCPGSNDTCCDNPVYNTSVFKRTIITEWNLICERDWLKDLTQTIFQFGVFCGSLLFGIASDKWIWKKTDFDDIDNIRNICRHDVIVFAGFLELFVCQMGGWFCKWGMYNHSIRLGDGIRWTKKPRSTALDLFRTPHLRTNITVMSFVWLVCSYCFYGVTYYIGHLTGNIFINVLATGGVCTCAVIISIPLIKFYKRKTVVVFGNVICSLCLLTMGFVPEGKATLVVGCIGEMHSYIIFIVIYLYCSEMFPTVVRNAAIGICSMVARVGAMIAPFAASLHIYGKWCSPVAFGIFPMISAFLCLLLLPETKDCELLVTLEEAENLGRKIQISRSDNSLNFEESEV